MGQLGRCFQTAMRRMRYPFTSVDYRSCRLEPRRYIGLPWGVVVGGGGWGEGSEGVGVLGWCGGGRGGGRGWVFGVGGGWGGKVRWGGGGLGGRIFGGCLGVSGVEGGCGAGWGVGGGWGGGGGVCWVWV